MPCPPLLLPVAVYADFLSLWNALSTLRQRSRSMVPQSHESRMGFFIDWTSAFCRTKLKSGCVYFSASVINTYAANCYLLPVSNMVLTIIKITVHSASLLRYLFISHRLSLKYTHIIIIKTPASGFMLKTG